MAKAVFSIEILENFNFYPYFLATLWLSDVPLYVDENPITTSASKQDSPFSPSKNAHQAKMGVF
ncbi:MAG: hypothetical protein IJX94_05665 [Clostridia bacterium]|nr:hypothetical protein [Clostridia bacterium]